MQRFLELAKEKLIGETEEERRKTLIKTGGYSTVVVSGVTGAALKANPATAPIGEALHVSGASVGLATGVGFSPCIPQANATKDTIEEREKRIAELERKYGI